MIETWRTELSPRSFYRPVIKKHITSDSHQRPCPCPQLKQNWNCCLELCPEHGTQGCDSIEGWHIPPETKRGECPLCVRNVGEVISLMGLFRKQMTSLELVVASFHNLWKRRAYRIISEEQQLEKEDLPFLPGKILPAVIPIYFNCNVLLKQDLKKRKEKKNLDFKKKMLPENSKSYLFTKE